MLTHTRSIVAVMVTLAVLGGCTDRVPLQPEPAQTAAPEPAVRLTSVATVPTAPGACRQRVGGFYTTNLGGAAMPWTFTGCTVPESVFTRVTLEGRFEVGPNPAAARVGPGTGGKVGAYGPMGTPANIAWQEAVHSVRGFNANSGTQQLAANRPAGSPDISVLFFEGGFSAVSGPQQLMVARTALTGEAHCSSHPTTPQCPDLTGAPAPVQGWSVGFYQLQSQVFVVVTPQASTLVVDLLSPTGDVVEGDSVTVRARSTDGRSVQVRSWRFQPDSGGPPMAICASNQVTCGFRPATPGRVYVRARFNHSGWQFQAHRAIAVSPVRLVLTASSLNPTAGETVHFVVSASAARPIAGAQWTALPRSNVVAASSLRSSVIEPLFASLQGMAVSGCEPGNLTCSWQTAETYWKRVTATVNGIVKTDSVLVTVTPCPTGDQVLDQQAMRDLLRELERRAFSYHPPREFTGIVVKRPDGSFTFRVGPPGTCASSSYPDRVSGDSIVAAAHIHPFSLGDLLPCAPGKAYGLGPADKIPSGPDWRQVQGSYAVPHVVIDKDSVARMNVVPDNLYTRLVRIDTAPNGVIDTIMRPEDSVVVANTLQLGRRSGSCRYP